MSRRDFTTALALLLSDSSLRARFRNDPAAVAAELIDDDAERAQLQQLCPDQLDAQARTLIAKRRSQVAQFLPLTWAALGEEALGCFEQYAQQHPWPETHKRHLQDAIEFAAWVGQHRPDRLVRHEQVQCTFRAGRQRLSFYLISHPSIPFRRRGWLLLCRTRRGVSAVRFGLP